MLSNNCYAKIKEVKPYGNTLQVKIVCSHKDKNSNEYITDFMGNTTFVGKAVQQVPAVGQRIQIISMGINNCYVKDGELTFLKAPKITVFDYKIQDTTNPQTNTPIKIEDNFDEAVPF